MRHEGGPRDQNLGRGRETLPEFAIGQEDTRERRTLSTTSSTRGVPGASLLEREEKRQLLALPGKGSSSADSPGIPAGSSKMRSEEDWTLAAAGDPAFWLK